MRNITILCNSSYQVMVAFYIINKYFKNDKVFFLVSSKINGYEQILFSIKKYKLVEQAECINTDYIKKIQEHAGRKILFHLRNKKELKKYLDKCTENLPEKCDVFLCSNIELFGVGFCKVYQCEMQLYEDGIATYSMEMGIFYMKAKGFVAKNRQRRYRCYLEATKIYLFTPEYLLWKPPFKIEVLESCIKDEAFIKEINLVFSYDKTKEKYMEPYIFFEEAYYADGRNIDDISIVNEIVKVVGKNQVLIKLHPRNKENRFEELGYRTNSNSGIPWEVIALNMNMQGKTVITIASAAAVTPQILFGKKMNVVLLYEMLPEAPLKRDVLAVLKRVCENNKEFFIPTESKELKIFLLRNEEKRKYETKHNANN